MAEMEKKEQLLICDPPSELRFRGPFVKPIVTNLLLKNPTDRCILFKIKTTAPRKYCVRPNVGMVDPHQTTKVEICLQVIALDPNEKNKHKFMVQSLVVPENMDPNNEASEIEKLWQDVKPEDLMDTKLRCVFELPGKSPAGDSAAPNDSTTKNVITKAGGDQKSKEDIINDYIRATNEVRQLQEEQSLLRVENIKLNEQLLRLRLSAEANQKEQPTSSSSYQNPYSPPQLGQQQIPVMYIALAIAMGLFGLLLGKYLL